MSRFTSEFVLVRGIGVDTWKLAKPLRYESEMLSGLAIVIPSGFETDFASIPRFFHRLIPKNGLHDPAAVIHDFLYSKNGEVQISDERERKRTARFSQETCDKIFLEAMKSLGVGWFNRHIMFKAVRMFGWAAWNAHAKRIKKENDQSKRELDAANFS